MTDWIAAARLENQKKAGRPTAKTAKTPIQDGQSEVSSVLAVPHRPIFRKSSPRVELMGLVHAAASFYAFDDAERQEALSLAVASPSDALVTYRDIAARHGISVPTDDRVTCAECRRLVRDRCEAARMGLMKDTQSDYWPVPDVPRRCEHFMLKGEQ